MKVKCDWCGKKVEKSPSEIGKHSFCSRTCFGKFRSRNYKGQNSWLYKKVEPVECDWCGKKIRRTPSRAKKNNFCSRECYWRWQSKNRAGENSPTWKGGKATVICEYCGKKVKVFRAVKDRVRFCSEKCWGKWLSKNWLGEKHPSWKGGMVSVKCDYCGRKTKKKLYMIKKNRHHFCSRECLNKWQKETGNLTGEDNPRWRGGYEPYYGSNWRVQRRKARARDNHTCQICSEKENGWELPVHHIIPFREFGLENYKKANRLDNLITLCYSCHRKVESGALNMGEIAWHC